MKKALALIALVALAAPAQAEEISKSTLSSLGLGSMKATTDASAMKVRGMSSNAFAGGGSLIVGQLVDPSNPTNFFFASDYNSARATDENAGLSADSLSTQGATGSSIIGNLNIQSGNPAVQVFLGSFAGNAGNASNPGAAGLSAATAN